MDILEAAVFIRWTALTFAGLTLLAGSISSAAQTCVVKQYDGKSTVTSKVVAGANVTVPTKNKAVEYTLRVDGVKSSFQAKSFLENGKPYVLDVLYCNTTLDCSGSRVHNATVGKVERSRYSIQPSTGSVVARIKNGEVFRYRTLPGGFSYAYVEAPLKGTKFIGVEVICGGGK